MGKFAVVVFPDEPKATQGVHMLQQLHRDAVVTVYGAIVVLREGRGALSVRGRAAELPLGLGSAALVGGLVALFGGRVGTGSILYSGDRAVSWREYRHAGVSEEFLESVVGALVPGTCGVVAEFSEESAVPLDTSMGALGGKVVRDSREGFVDELLETAANIRRAELAARSAERALVRTGRMASELLRAFDEAQAKLERTAADIRERLEHAKEELDAKIEVLEEQAAAASPEVRSRIERRIRALRDEFRTRETRLERAYRVAQAAVLPTAEIARERR